MILDKHSSGPQGLVISVEVEDDKAIREWSWIRLGEGGINEGAPLGYVGKTTDQLRSEGFRKRASQEQHPGA